ncbi:transcriptional regulator, partial [Pusillimonas sp. TS35]|nr:transcriptional regulator [Pusillimonas sp. TS35]
MTAPNQNPFVLPGLGQGGDTASNPLLASMEMMRQAWQAMAGLGSRLEPGLGVPMSVEDLDQRISDLRAVENWLRLNLSMLSNTIQGLEVQRATLATFKSFMGSAMSGGDAGTHAGTAAAGAGRSAEPGTGGTAEAGAPSAASIWPNWPAGAGDDVPAWAPPANAGPSSGAETPAGAQSAGTAAGAGAAQG